MSMNFKSINLKLVVLFSAFWCFLVLFSAFWCFFVLVKSYRKKNKKFKTDLITLFIPLLMKESQSYRMVGKVLLLMPSEWVQETCLYFIHSLTLTHSWHPNHSNAATSCHGWGDPYIYGPFFLQWRRWRFQWWRCVGDGKRGHNRRKGSFWCFRWWWRGFVNL